MTSISAPKAVLAALLLAVSIQAAPAQTVSDDPRTAPGETIVQKMRPTQLPPTGGDPPTTGSIGNNEGSVARDAIRVPAFGTAEPKALTLAQQRPRAVRRLKVVDLPPPVVVRPVYPRFGYGYGPGARLYRW